MPAVRLLGLMSVSRDTGHQNPVVKKIYEEYLEKPGSYRAEKLLHTTYREREKYQFET